MSRTMREAALEALSEADVVLLVVDGTVPPRPLDRERITEALEGVTVPLHVAVNKIDAAPAEAIDAWDGFLAEALSASPHRVSATRGEGTDALLDAVAADLPEGPFLYPEDEIASDPVRFFVAELVRETVFEQYEQEIPYSVFCLVEEFREQQDPVYVHVDIHVERKSQKGILIGKGGTAIKSLGAAARAKIEHFLGRRVYLDLWVKPLDSWRKSRSHLGKLGFRLPSDDESTPG
jgi:GTP-binding protein Era